jgi:hypothetical protein
LIFKFLSVSIIFIFSQSSDLDNLNSESNCFLSILFYLFSFFLIGNATSAEVVMSELDEPRRGTRQKSNASVVEGPIEEEENDEVGPAQVLTDSILQIADSREQKAESREQTVDSSS